MPTLTIQPSTKDTFIQANAPTSNRGSYTYLEAYAYTNALTRTLIEFDLSSLPGGATITSVTLWLYYWLYEDNDPVGFTMRVHRLRRADWEELQSTWNIYKTGSNWGTAGAANTTTDIDTSFQSDAVVPADYGWMSWDVKLLAEDAVANRSNKLIARIHDTGASAYRGTFWHSKEYADDLSLRPKLVIGYTVKGKSYGFIID